MDPVVEFFLTYALGKGIDLSVEAAQRFATANTRAIESARAPRLQDFAYQSIREMRAVMERLEDVEREQVRQRAEDGRLAELWLEYGDDAQREVIDGRRAMIALASTCLVDLDIDFGQAARVRRIINELDPHDVLALQALVLVPSVQAPGLDRANLEMKAWESLGAEALEPSGCVRIAIGGGGAGQPPIENLRITDTGRLVLRAMRSFLKARDPIFAFASQRAGANYRTREEALELTKGVPDLFELVSQSGRKAVGAIQYDSPKPLDATPPANARGRLIFYGGTAALGHVCAFGNEEGERIGDIVNHLWLRVQVHPTEDHIAVDLYGPHDILRAIALEVGARWA